MPHDHTVLRRCRNCKKHCHWLYVDGTRSEEFYSVSDGALAFLEALSSGKAEAKDTEAALHNLKKSGLMNNPEEAKNLVKKMTREYGMSVEEFLQSIPSLFRDEFKSKKDTPSVH